jgi:bifunctional non-homologous end joining protein LigD
VARPTNSPDTGGNAWICPSLDRGRRVPRENILQLQLLDAVALSKEQLAAYWRKVAQRALPYLGVR